MPVERDEFALFFSYPEKVVRFHMSAKQVNVMKKRFDYLVENHGNLAGVEIQFYIPGGPPLILARKELNETHVSYTEEWRQRFGENGPHSNTEPAMALAI